MHKLAIVNSLNNSNGGGQSNGSRPASVSLVSLPLHGGGGTTGNAGGSKSVNTSPSNSSKS